MKNNLLKAFIPFTGAVICAGLSGYLLYLLYIKNDDDEDITRTDSEVETIKYLVTEKVLIPKHSVGLVIGKQGSNVQIIQRETCTNITVSGKDNMDQFCIIRGREDNVEKAKTLILKYCKDNGNFVELKFSIPQSACGKIIGKGGATINQISQSTGAKVNLDRQEESFDVSDSNTRTVTIRGDKDAAEAAKKLVLQKVQEDSSFRGGPRKGASMRTSPRGKYREEEFAVGRTPAALNTYSDDVRNSPLGKSLPANYRQSVLPADRYQQEAETAPRRDVPLLLTDVAAPSQDKPMVYPSPVSRAAEDDQPTGLSPVTSTRPAPNSGEANKTKSTPHQSPNAGEAKKKKSTPRRSPGPGTSKKGQSSSQSPVARSANKNQASDAGATNRDLSMPCPLSATETSSSPGVKEEQPRPLPLMPAGRQAVFNESSEMKTVFVTAVASATLFWIQEVSPKMKELEILSNTMTHYYSYPGNRRRLRRDQRKPGALIAASYPGDSLMHRGRIEAHQARDNPNLVVVFYLDYGDTMLLEPSNVYELHPQYLQLEFQAIQCCLHGAVEMEGKQKQAREQFLKLSHAARYVPVKARKVTSKTVTERILPALELLCNIDGQEINIAADLIRRKFLQKEADVSAQSHQLPDDVIVEC